MIKKIILSNIATFQTPVHVEPKKVNYIYGANGSGKTTISKLLSTPDNYPQCNIIWENNQIEILVYNRDFIKNNFHQDKLKGIFTLGKDVPETEGKIKSQKKIIDEEDSKIINENKSLKNLNKTKKEIDDKFNEECWQKKVDYDKKFKESIAGSVKSKAVFKQKCIEEQHNTAELKDIKYLTEKYNSLYNTELIPVSEISQVSIDALINIETANIFGQSIIGKSESQISELITFGIVN